MALLDGRKVLAVSLVVNAALALALAAIALQYYSLSSQINVVKEQNAQLAAELNSMKQKNELLQSQLEYYKAQAEYYSRFRKSSAAGEGLIGNSSVNIVAVREVLENFFEVRYEGVTMKAKVELKRGEGRILINTQPKVGIDLQTSARTARLVAERFAGVSLEKTDVILTIMAKSNVEVVDGPSAGAAITVALISAMLNETLDESVFMTGTINPDGSVGWVGGILEKAVAASQSGASKFLIPRGQRIISVLKPEKKEIAPGVTIVFYRIEKVDVEEYLRELGYEVKVIEVGNITEAYNEFTAQQTLKVKA